MPSLSDFWVTYFGQAAPFFNNGGHPIPNPNSLPLTGISNTPALLAAPVQVGATGSRRLHAFNVHNPNAAVTFIQMFNSVAAPVVGTDVPTRWIAVPANGVVDGQREFSAPFNLGLWIAATTTPNGAIAAAAGCPVSLGFI